MLLVSVRSLRPGMTLAQPVFHPCCQDLVLLNEGFDLTEETITRLAEFRLTHVWIDFPGLEGIDAKINGRISRNHMQLCQTLNESVQRLERRVVIRVKLADYKRAVRQMLTDIVAAPDHAVVTQQLTDFSPVLSGHMANCCYLALLVGAHMSGYLKMERPTLPEDLAENTSHLGLGALLHDVGKLNMPPELQNKSVLDREGTWPEYRMHVRAGYEAIHEHIPVLSANVVLHHHQRIDGNGFPDKESRNGTMPPEPLRGRAIHIFSRICAVVDCLDHLMCPHGRMVPTVMAIHALKDERFARWFDPVVVETLLRLIPPFMVGSVVTLSNGREAVVIANHPEAPCRPTVKLLNAPVCDPDARVRAQELDLRMCRDLSIAWVDGLDVRPYLYSGELEMPVPAMVSV